MAFIPVYILILALTIVVDYIAGMWLENAEGTKKKAILWVSLLTTVLILFVFKYFNFFAWNVTHAAQFLGWNYSLHALEIILPIGLSFHTFQSMSYVIEVYRGKQKAERHFGIYSLYVMFYPQLVAGPIERPQNLLHQFWEPKQFNYDDVTAGLRLMAAGLFRKIVIADNLAQLVNHVYAKPGDQSPAALLVATVFFAFQIYCDFSGYSAMAIGAARVMGFRLMSNFERPYLSQTISEFWTRWHISLSTWFKDYVYIPLGGSRVGKFRHWSNLMIVFLISGIWHGSNWTYIIWGGLHGSFLILEQWTKGLRADLGRITGLANKPRVSAVLNTIYVFILVDISWVFFRATSLSDALHITASLPLGLWQLVTNIASPDGMRDLLGGLGMQEGRFLFCVGLILAMLAVEVIQNKLDWEKSLLARPVWQRWAVYYAALLMMVFASSLNNGQSFIYFQF